MDSATVRSVATVVGSADGEDTSMPEFDLDRDSTTYFVLHLLLLLIAVFGAVAVLDGLGDGLDFWAGLIVAILVAIAYPRIVVRLGVAPKRWE